MRSLTFRWQKSFCRGEGGASGWPVRVAPRAVEGQLSLQYFAARGEVCPTQCCAIFFSGFVDNELKRMAWFLIRILSIWGALHLYVFWRLASIPWIAQHVSI